MRRLCTGIFYFITLCCFAEAPPAEAPPAEAPPAEAPPAEAPPAEAPPAEAPPAEAPPAEAPPAEAPPAPEVRLELVEDLFRAVAGADAKRVGEILAEGADVNAVLPFPPPEDLVVRFRGQMLEYYLKVEKGLTPLMLASAMGYPEIVRLLLDRGAKPQAGTKKHRTNALWLAGRNGHVEVMQILLGVGPGSEAARLKIRISVADQTAWLWKDGQIVRTMPVSTGRKKFPTPTGRFVVTDKHRDWKSTIYPARMPYYLRLSCRDFGIHAGVVPGYPASHGCVRIPTADAKVLFAEIPQGTLVEIE